ncbi:hypothetical protein ACLKA7_004820 [Drosophila subpalustris]
MDIYSAFGKDGLRPADLLIECVDCNVGMNDPFPKKICLTCVVATKKAFEFKRRYEKSHQQFCDLSHINNVSGNLPNPQDAECEERTSPQKENDTMVEGEPNGNDVQMLEIKLEVECETNDKSLPDINTNLMDNNNEVVTHFCPTCGEGFPNNTKRILHSLIHYKLKYNQCPYCPKRYKTRLGLKGHVIVHAGERRYKCPHCPKEFTCNYRRNKHVLLHAVCNYCGKLFKTDELLQKHLRLHSSDRPFQCPHCSYRFLQKTFLKNHIASTHSSKRPYKCCDCLKTFTILGNYNHHKRFDCRATEKNS